MSVFRVDLVGPSLGGTTRSLVRGTAAAWVNFNGTGTIAARDSENVSSLTDNGTGDYTVNFSNAFGAADYGFTTGGSNVSTDGRYTFNNNGAPVASAFRFQTTNAASAASDGTWACASIHGDLA